MTAATVLAEAHAAGVELIPTAEGKIRWRCKGSMPAFLRDMILDHKGELLLLLSARRPTYTVRPLWFLLPNGMPVHALSPDLAPANATHWCREGDTCWQSTASESLCELP
jgi:hypothetical protein